MAAKTSTALCAGIAAAFTLTSGVAHAQLVIEGEQIADKALFEAAKREGELSIYGTWPPANQKLLSDAFSKDTGIKVSFVRATSGKMFPRVLAEFSTGRLGADFVDLTDLTLIKQLVEKGVLNVPYKSPTYDKIDEKLKGPEGRWYSFVLLTQVFGVNKAIVPPDEMPKGFADLLKPRWKNRIGMPTIDAGGSSFSVQAFMKEELGDDYWHKLKAQNPRIYPSVAPSVTDMVRGETLVSLAGSSTIVNQIKSGAPVQLIFPEEGVPSFPLSGGITASARNPNAAKLYVNYLTSVRGGNVIVSTGNYAAHPETKRPTLSGYEFPPRKQLWSLGADHWAKVRDSYSEEWREVFRAN